MYASSSTIVITKIFSNQNNQILCNAFIVMFMYNVYCPAEFNATGVLQL